MPISSGYNSQVEENRTYTAFSGPTLLATGPLDTVLTAVKTRFDADPGAIVPIFEDHTGRQVDFDLRGPLPEVLTRAMPEKRTGPGRPKLGVTAREVSLLPRHWEWLEQQPNGASAALRRLVDDARKKDPGEHRVRLAIEAAARFLSAIAGNLPNYEEATRALYNRNRQRLEELIGEWPGDIRAHVVRLVEGAL
jgi:hypothetical protein